MNRFWRKFTQPMSAVTQMWILFSPFLRTLLDVQPSLLTISCSYIYNSLLSLHVRFCFIFAYPSNIHALTSNNFLQGSHASLEHIDDKIPQLDSPLCLLKQISFEMSCKSPRDEIGHKTTLAILNKLSNYEWNAKAVLTMAAFALEYSEFWMHASSVPTILLQNLWLY
ncbi:hypothetical protein AAZX31_20G190700 [Glycine max]